MLMIIYKFYKDHQYHHLKIQTSPCLKTLHLINIWGHFNNGKIVTLPISCYTLDTYLTFVKNITTNNIANGYLEYV